MVCVIDKIHMKIMGARKAEKGDFWSFVTYIISWANILNDHQYRKKDTAYFSYPHVRTETRVKGSGFWFHLLHSFPYL